MTTFLKQNPDQLKHLVLTIQEFDKEHQTHHYEALRHTLISADQEFQRILDELATASSTKENISTFSQSYITAISGTNPKLNGSFLESSNEHGDKISVDVSKEPPIRTLSLNDSEYAMETEA